MNIPPKVKLPNANATNKAPQAKPVALNDYDSVMKTAQLIEQQASGPVDTKAPLPYDGTVGVKSVEIATKGAQVNATYYGNEAKKYAAQSATKFAEAKSASNPTEKKKLEAEAYRLKANGADYGKKATDAQKRVDAGNSMVANQSVFSQNGELNFGKIQQVAKGDGNKSSVSAADIKKAGG